MKLVDQQRLVKALKSVDKAREKKTEARMKIVQALAMRGMHALVDKAFDLEVDRTIEDQKIALEALFLDQEIRRDYVDKTFELLEHYDKYREIIYSIQSRYQISGLVRCHSTGLMIEHSLLRLVDADLKLLANQKNEAFGRFLLSAKEKGITKLWWYDTKRPDYENWVEVSKEKLSLMVQSAEWFDLWPFPSEEEVMANLRNGAEDINSISITAKNSTPYY